MNLSEKTEEQAQSPPERKMKKYWLGFDSKKDGMLYFDIVLFQQTASKLFRTRLDLTSDFDILLTHEQLKYFELDLEREKKKFGLFDVHDSCGLFHVILGAPVYDEDLKMFKCRFGSNITLSDQKSEKGKEEEIIVGKLWLDRFLKVFKEESKSGIVDIKDWRTHYN